MAKKAKAGKGDKKGKGKKKDNKAKGKVAERAPPPKAPFAVVCQSNRYPGILSTPEQMAILGATVANYPELCSLISNGFLNASRILVMTNWGNYAIFREFNGETHVYFLHDGCSCSMEIFRHFNLKAGTAGLLYFQSTHEIVKYILESRFRREKYKFLPKTNAIDQLCRDFCIQGGENMYKICNRRGSIENVYDCLVKQCLQTKCKQRRIQKLIGCKI